MDHRPASLPVCFTLGILVTLSAAAAPISITTVPVGDLGNPPDTTGFGSVSYGYSIGVTEVTNAQYAAFLNEKAKSDPLFLYNESMGFNASDQGGNVGEWTELQSSVIATSRSSRGGAFNFVSSGMLASNDASSNATTEVFGRGFRVTTTGTTLVSNADFDRDGDVDGSDFLVWQRGGAPHGVNSGELAFWESQYGSGAPLAAVATAVPEPGSLMLIGIGLTALAAQRPSRGSISIERGEFTSRC